MGVEPTIIHEILHSLSVTWLNSINQKDPLYLEFKKYRRKVYYWTSKNDLTQLENYDKRGRSSFHLDHKYSITEGFKNKVPPKVIGSIDNLEFICYTDNLSKGTKCSITLEKLNELFAAVD